MTASAKRKAPQEEGQAMEFSAEISKVLQLMIHSLYTNRDIFLRELVSNASDACDKLRFEALQNDGLYAGDKELKISLLVDKKAHTICIADNGIGMSCDELIANLGTIAKSGTQEFSRLISGDAQKDMSLIGQFGVGFYSAFMVADRVTVISRSAHEAIAHRWESDGLGGFTVEPLEGEHPRGTSITLHIKKEAKEYLDFFRLRHIVQTYSDHVSFPIFVSDGDENNEQVNQAGAIWMRAKSDISPEQYEEFYHHVSHSPDKPFLTLHHKAEGTVEYTSLLYVPSMKPFDLFHPDRRARVKLYVKRVFITDEQVEIVPRYLRFLRGVVDSPDVPLNISRETLQANPAVRKIRDAVTKKLLSELIKSSEKDAQAYIKFWENFGAVLKEGLCESDAPKDRILEACRFYSTHGDALMSLKDYVARMKEGQEAIYVMAGDSLEQLRRSPQLEGFRKHGVEVLLLTDHVDDFWLGVNPKYADKPFRSVLKHGDDLKAFSPHKEKGADDESAVVNETDAKQTEALAEVMKSVLGDAVRQVRATGKLSESPVCLAIGEGDMDLRMERFLLEHKQLPKGMPKILEINPDHPIIRALAADPSGQVFEDKVWLLFEQANIQEGEPVKDPAAFAQRLGRLMA